MRRSRRTANVNEKASKIENVLVIDYSNFLHRAIYSAMNDDKYCSNNYALWKSYMLVGKYQNDGIFGLIMKMKPDRVIIALDERYTWRKDLNDEYKILRGVNRKKSKVNFEEFFPIANEFLEDLRKLFKNLAWLNVEKCEADDIIALTVDTFHKDCNITIASNDGDFYQTQKHKNVRQYSPQKRDYIVCPNPVQALRIKILTGDDGDCISNIKSGVGPVKAEKILKEGLDEYLEKEGLRDKYILNRKLIDFDYIPEYIRENITQKYNELKISDVDSSKFFNFFIKHKLGGLAADFSTYSKSMERLI